MKQRIIAVAVFLLLVLGITTRSQVTQWFHHLGYYSYISNNTVEIAPNVAELEQREQYNADLAQYQRDKFQYDDMLGVARLEASKKAAELRAKGASEEEIDEETESEGTWMFHPPQPPKEPEAITKYKVPTNQGLSVLPMFSTELDRCVIIYSKDEDLKSKKIAQVVVENHYRDNADVVRTNDVTVWAETQNIVPAEPRPSVCQYYR